jgi:hypothetical protein
LKLKRFNVGSKMAIAASAPVLPNQKKQCCKIARFTDATCVSFAIAVSTQMKYYLPKLLNLFEILQELQLFASLQKTTMPVSCLHVYIPVCVSLFRDFI